MAEGRDEHGRFAPGNRFGAKENGGNGGRAPRVAEEGYLSILRDELTPDKFRKTVIWILENPSVAGIKLLWSYLMGAPPESIQVNGSMKTLVEYVNDWRTWAHKAADAASGPDSGPDASA